MFLFSCVDKEKTLDNGVKIKYLKRGDGQQINDGEIVMLNLQYFDYDGNELLDKTGKDPVVLQKDSSWKVNEHKSLQSTFCRINKKTNV